MIWSDKDICNVVQMVPRCFSVYAAVFDQLTRDRWRDFTMPGEAFVGWRPFRSDCADRCVLPVDRFHVEPDILLSDPLEQ